MPVNPGTGTCSIQRWYPSSKRSMRFIASARRSRMGSLSASNLKRRWCRSPRTTQKSCSFIVPSPSAAAALHCNYVALGRIDDGLDQSREVLQRIGFFLAVLMPVIDTLDTVDGMAHDTLCNIGAHIGTAQQAPRRPPPIMNGPRRKPFGQLAVNCSFCPRPIVKWSAATREDPLIAC